MEIFPVEMYYTILAGIAGLGILRMIGSIIEEKRDEDRLSKVKMTEKEYVDFLEKNGK